MTLGELLGMAREMKDITLRELERQTGISNAVINQMETGHIKNPSFANVVKVSRALGVRLDRLAGTIE
jgi:transcriptional regulator with XRE-family HTH domain